MTDASHARHHAYRETTFFGSLDGLRFLCIVLVLWHHGPIWTAMSDVPLILTRGFVGVDFFFVLSGFLITTLLLRENDRKGRISLIDFYRRRALRILPVYFLSISLISFWWIVVRGQQEWIPMLPYYFFFLGNFLIDDIPLLAPMWSLAVEEQYYVVWPMILVLVGMYNWRAAIAVILVGLCVIPNLIGITSVEPFGPTEHARFVLPLASYAALLIGSLTAIILHRKAGFDALWKVLGNPWAPWVLLVLFFVSLQMLPRILTGWPNLVMHTLMALTIAALVIREDHRLAPVMKSPLVARIGKVSYGLYIWHLIGLHIGNVAAGKLGLTGWVGLWSATIIYMISAVIIAELSFRYFESIFLRAKTKKRAETV